MLSQRVERFGACDWLWLVGLWGIVTAYNLFKPYHIDDTAHLLIARWIESHPLHPMSGLLNWGGVNEPIWKTNQPHLYFYMLAIWGYFFGFDEPAMHALQSLAALACILLFHRLVRALSIRPAIWITAMFVLGPAFIVEQNLMVDVPLLACWLAFFNLLICGVDDQTQSRRYILAGLACGLAVLIKYSSLVLFPILCISVIVERRRAQAWTLIIPVAILVSWSSFNYLDYGGVHILERPHEAGRSLLRPLKFAVAWFIGLGALTPLGLMAAVQSRSRSAKTAWAIYAVVVLAFVAFMALIEMGVIKDRVSDKLLWLVFAGNAGLICIALAPEAIRFAKLKPWRWDVALKAAPMLYIWLWIGGTTAFYVLLSPFIAARHLLLILAPVALLLVQRWGEQAMPASKVFGLALTVVVSAGLCLSDWRFAAFYRDEASALASILGNHRAIWASGHWGWQWYAKRHGFKEVDVRSSAIKPGDILIVPREVDHQPLQTPPPLTLRRVDTEQDSGLDIFCTGRASRFYAYDYKQGPWSLTRSCLNHVDIFDVGPSGQNAFATMSSR